MSKAKKLIAVFIKKGRIIAPYDKLGYSQYRYYKKMEWDLFYTMLGVYMKHQIEP